MAKLGIFSIFLGMLVLQGCSYTMEQAGLYKGDHKVVGLQSFGEKTVTFEVVAAVSLKTCLECHTTGSHALNSAALVLESKDKILDEVHNKTMPPRNSGYATLNACETKILEIWIEDQTSNREASVKVNELAACGGMKAPVEKPKTDFSRLELNFDNLKREILTPKCLSCHAVDSPGYQYVLEDLQGIKDNDLLAAKAEDSTLFQVVNPGMEKYFMPPRKSGIKALTPEEVDYMKRWIEAGAL